VTGLAAQTQQALAELEVEPAPQKEADPTGKATVERAFRTVKDIAAPLLKLTDRLAARVPALACPSLARATATLLVTALLRAYQHGARAARNAVTARGNVDPDELARRAELSRERARATDRSTKLFLDHIHASYHLAGSVAQFIRALRPYPLPVLHDAEHALRQRLLREDLDPVADPWRYFAAIVRNLMDEYRRRRSLQRLERDRLARLAEQHAQHRARLAALRADPLAWLREALELLAAQWLPDQHQLLFGGTGLGLGTLQAALAQLLRSHGPAALDLAHGGLHDFRLAHLDRLGPDGLAAILHVANRELTKLQSTQNCSPANASAILARTGKKPRPPPPNRLRI
jgi:hypothetical protein